MSAVLEEAQRALLKSVLNRLVPAHDDLPGAGDLAVGASIERSMAGSARLRRLFLDGLAEIAITAERPFVELDTASQTAILEVVEVKQPAFFGALVEHTYRGYYTLPAVHEAIGHESRPPQPLGHRLPPFDPALLDRQRARLPFWRQTP
jgi:gluconate 2-dehydrogenase subunit 3-like protein